jgi:ferredoxin
MPKVIHYRNKCIGCNSCVEHSPEHWKISLADGKSTLQSSTKKREVWVREITLDEVSKNESAAADCPVNIIKVKK